MCNCIKELEDEISKEYSIFYDSDTYVRAIRPDIMLFGVKWKVTRKNNDGTKYKDWCKTARYDARKFNYCPFCGEKIHQK